MHSKSLLPPELSTDFTTDAVDGAHSSHPFSFFIRSTKEYLLHELIKIQQLCPDC